MIYNQHNYSFPFSYPPNILFFRCMLLYSLEFVRFFVTKSSFLFFFINSLSLSLYVHSPLFSYSIFLFFSTTSFLASLDGVQKMTFLLSYTKQKFAMPLKVLKKHVIVNLLLFFSCLQAFGFIS
jgi:hypothetical protein